MRDLGQVLNTRDRAAPQPGPNELKRTQNSATAKTYRWAIYRLRGTPAAFIGSVDAADEKGAIEAAIEQFGIDDPYLQRRLIARQQD